MAFWLREQNHAKRPQRRARTIMNFMFPVITLPLGLKPYERGRLFGQASAEQATRSLVTYARLFAFCGIDWAEAGRRARQYQAVIAELDPDLLTEMHGMAEGTGLTLSDVLALNCRTEILPPSFLSEDTHEAGAALAANLAAGLPDWAGEVPLSEVWREGECTAMCVDGSASANGQTWFAQNWDWVGRQRAALVILKSHDAQGRAFTTLTEAGMLAKIGMNDRGFALGLNILRSVRDGARPGVPVHVVLRHLLSCGSLAEARQQLDRVQALGFGAASNIPCADAQGEVACFEISPAGWAELRPSQGVVVHTNHFLCESLLTQQSPMGQALSSQPRLVSALRHAEGGTLPSNGKTSSKIGFPELQDFLRDESDGLWSICRSPDPALAPEARVESVAGIIMEPHSRSIWIAPDVPKKVAFSCL